MTRSKHLHPVQRRYQRRTQQILVFLAALALTCMGSNPGHAQATAPQIARLALVSKPAAAVFAPAAQAAGSVIINEVNTANTSGQRDEDGDPKDWIELYNTTSQAVDLSGMGLKIGRAHV